MRVLAGVLGFVVLAMVIADAFQTVVVARHAQKLPAMTRVFYRSSWIPFASIARLARSGELRERVLGLYGPLSLLILLVLWAVGVIVPFAMLQWATGLHLAAGPSTFANDVYFSGAAFFTLGSDQPVNLGSRYLMLLESGFGLSFLGLVIGYLPVLYQSFSSRELKILLLDARAGSPPSALEFLLRRADSPGKLAEGLEGWEEWALDLLQTHLFSYPMLNICDNIEELLRTERELALEVAVQHVRCPSGIHFRRAACSATARRGGTRGAVSPEWSNDAALRTQTRGPQYGRRRNTEQ